MFSPRDNDDTETWSSVFMLQQGHTREKQIRELLGERKLMNTIKNIFFNQEGILQILIKRLISGRMIS